MWITLEGNIGSGKTTLFDLMQFEKKFQSWVFVKEPVDQWSQARMDLAGQSMLDKFYESPAKHGPFFQTYALSTRLGLLNPIVPLMKDAVIVSERSPESDANIFAPLMSMTPFEKACYTSIYENLCQHLADVVVYLKTDPDIC